MGRLSGRPLLVVELSDLVAYGAAVQASAVLSGRPPEEVAGDWGARRGVLLPPVRRDDSVLEAVAAWRQLVLPSF